MISAQIRLRTVAPEIQAFATGFPATLANAGVTLGLLVAGAAAYATLSPYKEIQRVRDGDTGAAILFAGVILGLALPLALSLYASTTLAEATLWGVATIAVQLLAFRLIDLLLHGLPQRAREGEIGAAILLATARLAVALILAAAVSG